MYQRGMHAVSIMYSLRMLRTLGNRHAQAIAQTHCRMQHARWSAGTLHVDRHLAWEAGAADTLPGCREPSCSTTTAAHSAGHALLLGRPLYGVTPHCRCARSLCNQTDNQIAPDAIARRKASLPVCTVSTQLYKAHTVEFTGVQNHRLHRRSVLLRLYGE